MCKYLLVSLLLVGCAKTYPIPENYQITVTYRKCESEKDELQKVVWGSTKCKLITEQLKE
jgi:hypothetical protein